MSSAFPLAHLDWMGIPHGPEAVKLNRVERWVVNNPFREFWMVRNIGYFRRNAGVRSGGRVVEIGCGEGRGLGYLRRWFKPAQLAAFDLDIRMLRIASVKNQAPAAAADATFLPLKRASVDAVFAFGVLHHVPEWQRALSEISAVLRSGGVFCFEEFYPALYQNILTRYLLVHPETNRFRSREFKNQFGKVGLTIVHRIEIRPFYVLGVAIKQ